ncbi:MAG: aminotransferase class IV [bacterium]|nr:aminotransferase class IV [bacterium]
MTGGLGDDGDTRIPYTSGVMMVILNGKLTDESALPSRFLDGAYLYGAGVFETILFLDGTLPLLTHHVKRLQTSVKELGIKLSVSEAEIESGAAALATQNGLGSGTLNVYVSAGERQFENGRIDFAAPYWTMVLRDTQPTPTVNPLECCIALCTDHTGIAHHHKSMAYLHHIVALRQHDRHPVLTDEHGAIMETPLYGVGVIKDNRVLFPRHRGILPSTSRAFISQHAPDLGITVQDAPLYVSELHNYDGLFLHNAVKGIVPAKLHEHDTKKQGHKDPVLLSSNNTVSQLRDRYWRLIS